MEEKHCAQCSQLFVRSRAQSPGRFGQTKYCSRACVGASQATPVALKLAQNSRLDESGCLVWTAYICSSGYGTLCLRGRHSAKAHRVAYEMHHNVRIPDGMVVMHTCDKPACINPEHLRLGTVADNNRDRSLKKRSALGEKSPRAKITADVAVAIRNWNGSVRSAANHFGVTTGCVYAVLKRETWKHIE